MQDNPIPKIKRKFYLILQGASVVGGRYMITKLVRPGESIVVGYVYGFTRASKVTEFLKEEV